MLRSPLDIMSQLNNQDLTYTQVSAGHHELPRRVLLPTPNVRRRVLLPTPKIPPANYFKQVQSKPTHETHKYVNQKEPVNKIHNKSNIKNKRKHQRSRDTVLETQNSMIPQEFSRNPDTLTGITKRSREDLYSNNSSSIRVASTSRNKEEAFLSNFAKD